MNPRMYWFIILFVRSSEYFVLIVVGKNIFRKEICVRILVSFFRQWCSGKFIGDMWWLEIVWKIYSQYYEKFDNIYVIEIMNNKGIQEI